MELVLTIIAAPAQSSLLGQSQTFAANGATFGRAADNSWVLPDNDRVVSSRHATLSFQNGQYLLIDHSTNGTFLNGNPTPLGQGNSAVINNGDVVTIGPFQLQAILRAVAVAPLTQNLGGSFLDDLDFGAPQGAPASAPVNAPAAAAGSDDLDQWLEPMSSAAPSAPAWGNTPGHVSFGNGNPMPVVESHPETDPLALLGGGNDHWLNTPAHGNDDDWWQDSSRPDHAPADQHAMRIPEPRPAEPDTVNIDDLLGLAPAPAQPAAFAPERRDITAPNTAWPAQAQAPTPPTPPTPGSAPAMAQPAPPAQAAPPAPAAAPDLARALAERLGLAQLPDAQLANLVDEVAAVLRETTARLQDILRARSSIKNELRLERTMIGALENNPLKFSARPEDAMAYMFEDRGGAFLRAEAAIRDSFDDLAEHQVAVLAGMRAAYNAMLAHFDPAQMEQRFGAGGGLLANRKARNWEAYQEYYARLSADSENAYSRLFGETFARAYETQIDELKSARRFKSSR